MDQTSAILYLRSRFPNKPEEYIREMYQQCDNNMTRTLSAIRSDEPVKKSFFRRIFEWLTCVFWKKKSPGILTETPETSRENGLVEIRVGEDPVVRENVEIIARQQERLRQIERLTQRQEYARRSIQGSFVRQSTVGEGFDQRNAIIEESVHSRRLNEEPRNQIQAIPQIHFPFNYQRTNQHTEGFNENRVETDVDETDANLDTFSHPGTYYREQAQKYLKAKDQYYNKARSLGNRDLANAYFRKAKTFGERYEQANKMAVRAFLAENREKNPDENTLDLHHLYVKEAIQTLDSFLDERIQQLQNELGDSKLLKVIPGRGKHSIHGIPKIKPAVMERLEERSLGYTELNPGLLEVKIFKDSYFSGALSERECY